MKKNDFLNLCKLYLKLIMTFVAAILPFAGSVACEVCKSNQPEILQDITHGAGPGGMADYVIIWTSVVVVAVVLILSLKLLIKPGEKDPGHIKNITINKK